MEITKDLLKKVTHLRFLLTLLNQEKMEAKMSDLDLIKQLEKEIGREIKKRDFEKIMEYEQRGFTIDENGNVIGLNLDEITLGPLPSSLSKFRHLKKLSLHGTKITDISYLQGLSNLTELYLGANHITDISVLQGLSNLTHLYLGSNQITDFSSLKGLNSLTHLQQYKNGKAFITVVLGYSNSAVALCFFLTFNFVFNQFNQPDEKSVVLLLLQPRKCLCCISLHH